MGQSVLTSDQDIAGLLSSGNPTELVTSAPKLDYSWQLDGLGNWVATQATSGVLPGIRINGDMYGDGISHRLDRSHTVTKFNAIESVSRSFTVDGTVQTQETSAAIRDAAGNLLADDRYIYLYDAFNRLVMVRQRATATIQTTGPPTSPPGLVTAQGQWANLPPNPVVLLQLVHDAHDRVIRTQRALASWGDPANSPVGTPSTIPTVRIERHAYDGQRRIATVRVDEQTIDDQGQSSVSKDRQAPTSTTQIVATAFEYVWGPGDGLGGVDELVAVLADNWQFTPLLDHMGSVTGWTRTNLHPGPNLGQTQTLEHRVFDPYGQIIRRAGPLGPDIPIGHQGLFHERLDYADNPSAAPRVFEPWARHIVLNRSRVYLPTHGRFAQQDPNATGATPVTSVGFHGATPWAFIDRIDLRATFGDGLSIYGYVRNNPLQYSDPNGQFVFLLMPLLKYGGMALTAYGAGQTFVSAAQAIQAGTIGQQQVLIGLAADLLMRSNAAGRVVEKLLDAMNKGKVGRALQRVRVPSHDWHHTFPIFLGGNPDGLLVLMPRKLHQQFHGDLYKRLIAAGIPQPKKGETWLGNIQNTVGGQSKMEKALLDVSMEYDAKHYPGSYSYPLAQAAAEMMGIK